MSDNLAPIHTFVAPDIALCRGETSGTLKQLAIHEQHVAVVEPNAPVTAVRGIPRRQDTVEAV